MRFSLSSGYKNFSQFKAFPGFGDLCRMTDRNDRDRVPILGNDQGLPDRFRAEQRSGNPAGSHLQGSGQKTDILNGSPDSLVSHSLFQAVPVFSRIEAAVLFAQANEDQRWGCFDSAGGFQELNLGRFNWNPVLF